MEWQKPVILETINKRVLGEVGGRKSRRGSWCCACWDVICPNIVCYYFGRASLGPSLTLDFAFYSTLLLALSVVMNIFFCFLYRAYLVPVFSFGENELFNQVSNPRGSRLRAFQNKLMKILSFAPPLFFGRGILPSLIGIVPYRRPVCTVGK